MLNRGATRSGTRAGQDEPHQLALPSNATLVDAQVADSPLEDDTGDEPLGPRHPPRRRLVALVVAIFLLAITLMAAGYSLFGPPPHPERTRPLPPVIPTQGAVR